MTAAFVSVVIPTDRTALTCHSLSASLADSSVIECLLRATMLRVLELDTQLILMPHPSVQSQHGEI